MIKKITRYVMAVALSAGVHSTAQAALASNAVLAFESSTMMCEGGGVYPNCYLGEVPSASGSYFAIDLNNDGAFTSNERQQIHAGEGIKIGVAQPATGSHSGFPDGSEDYSIDSPFSFLANTGMHQTTSPVNILSDNGMGTVALDFSGWGLTWNTLPNIPLGGDPANYPSENGVANLICGSTCEVGDSFILTYTAHVPVNDPSNFGTVGYSVHLVGTIATPVPAAVWLFGSGLLGLLGIAHRRNTVF